MVPSSLEDHLFRLNNRLTRVLRSNMTGLAVGDASLLLHLFRKNIPEEVCRPRAKGGASKPPFSFKQKVSIFF
jgi:hypothetical protein